MCGSVIALAVVFVAACEVQCSAVRLARDHSGCGSLSTASCVKIMPLTRSVECEWLNKPPLPTNVSDTVNAPLPYTLDVNDSGGNNSSSLSDVAECSIIPDKNTPPSKFLPDYNTVYTSVDTGTFSQSHPLPLIIEHKHPFGLKNPKFQCFFNSVLQLIFSIFRNNNYTSPFNSSTEGTL